MDKIPLLFNANLPASRYSSPYLPSRNVCSIQKLTSSKYSVLDYKSKDIKDIDHQFLSDAQVH